MEWMARGAILAVAFLTAAGCGGGGGGGGDSLSGRTPSGSSSYRPGVYPASSSLANQCSTPMAQNMFLRSWTNETYLWYDEVPDINPTGYTTLDYFDELQTTQTASGNDKDRFHFTYPTDEWIALSQQATEIGYGAQWIFVPQTNANSLVMTAFIEPGTVAAQNGIIRGTRVLAVDGIVVANIVTAMQEELLYAALFPGAANEPHTFTLRDANGTQRDVTMTSSAVTYTAVPTWSVINQPDGPVGYLLFNDHNTPSERQLVDAITGLRDAGVRDLVLDLRYNGGGYLAIANELAYMIGNTTRTAGRTFERLIFNNKYTTVDMAGQAIAPTPFYSTARGFSVPTGTSLPSLNLERVYVLTGRNTCSASESIINGLRGVGVQVYQIGETTCGKPYGFYPEDNCGTTYFSIQFRGVNAADFGAYSDGFVPGSADSGSTIRGCRVADDFNNELGDPLEARLQTALGFRASNNQSCPVVVSSAPPGSSKPAVAGDGEGWMFKSPARENRIVERPRTGIAF